VLVFTKRDLLPPDASMPQVEANDALATHMISSASGHGLEDLKEELWQMIRQERTSEEVEEKT
jgi:50S ribosomal subunit-associated GTPase HflX